MAAPLRNRMFLKKISSKGLIFKLNDVQTQVKLVPLKCQNIRRYSSLQRLGRHRHTIIRGERYKRLCSVTVIRHASSNQDHIPDGYIPDVPNVPEMEAWERIPQCADLNALGEPTLQSIGLGGYWPPGLIQQFLEAVHVNLDVPWFTSIAICVVVIRCALFPVIIKQRKTLVRYHNIQPEIQKIQKELAEAQAATDYMEASKSADQMKEIMTKNNISMKNIFLPMLIQAPVFLSVFIGLRRMAEFPVLSMQTGGMLWFEDLTIADPTMMLPVITAATLWINLELGAESMKSNSAAMTPLTRAIMRVMPLVTLVAATQFPAALCVYWGTSNIFTLAQAQFLRIPAVRAFFGIPVENVHPDTPTAPRPAKVVKRLKDAYRTTSKLSEAKDREHITGMQFKQSSDQMGGLRRESDELMQEGWKETTTPYKDITLRAQEVVRPSQTVNKEKQDPEQEQDKSKRDSERKAQSF